MTSEFIGFQLLKKRAVRGVAVLTGRTFLLQAVASMGFFALTVFLGQDEIGLFFAVSEIVAILGYFSDVGLAAALIQKKGALKEADIRSTFLVQELIVLLLITVTLALTPFIQQFYEISTAGVWLLRALLAGFFLASLKTIPSVLLERKLRFDLQVVVELVETIIFYGVSVWLAWQGAGVMSYAWAVFLRGLAGAILINLLSPWPIGFSFRRQSLRKLLRFGVPYQANSVLAVVKDRLMNVFLWRVIGSTGVGILGWAQKWAQLPLRLIMDPCLKVTFPTFSRLQLRPKKLARALSFSLFSVTLLAFPLLAGVSLVVAPFIRLVPNYEKWLTAVLPLQLFAFNGAWAAISTPLTNAFNAIGKIRLTFKLMILWTSLTWLLTPLLAIKYGYLGAATALGLVPVSSVIVFALARKKFKISVWGSVSRPLASMVVMSLAVVAFQRVVPIISWPRFGVMIGLGGLTYTLSILVLAKRDVLRLVRVVKDGFAR